MFAGLSDLSLSLPLADDRLHKRSITVQPQGGLKFKLNSGGCNRQMTTVFSSLHQLIKASVNWITIALFSCHFSQSVPPLILRPCWRFALPVPQLGKHKLYIRKMEKNMAVATAETTTTWLPLFLSCIDAILKLLLLLFHQVDSQRIEHWTIRHGVWD